MRPAGRAGRRPALTDRRTASTRSVRCAGWLSAGERPPDRAPCGSPRSLPHGAWSLPHGPSRLAPFPASSRPALRSLRRRRQCRLTSSTPFTYRKPSATRQRRWGAFHKRTSGPRRAGAGLLGPGVAGWPEPSPRAGSVSANDDVARKSRGSSATGGARRRVAPPAPGHLPPALNDYGRTSREKSLRAANPPAPARGTTPCAHRTNGRCAAPARDRSRPG